MIGIVIVSHSEQLAAGVRELAMQMVNNRVPIALAAGMDDAADPIGTDAMRVVAAIEAVYSDDGVLILMDLGSALMSAEAALEFFDPEQQKNIFLCEAPLVEGTIAAAVQAMIGGSMAQVIAEARGALAAKTQQLAPFLSATDTQSLAAADAGSLLSTLAEAQTLPIIVPNAFGLHMRPLAKLIETISHFTAEVYVTNAGETVNARSINKVATLGARQGDELIFQALGQDAQAALAAIQTLADANFGERDEEGSFAATTSGGPETTEVVAANGLAGIPASPGIAIGPVARYRHDLPAVEEHTIEDSTAEWSQFQAALQAALAELQQVQGQIQQTNLVESTIFVAHRLMLQDPDLQADVRQQIYGERRNAAAAWQRAIQTAVDRYQALDDVYLRERAVDALDVGRRVLRHLLHVPLPTLQFDQPIILVAAELTPSETAQLNPNEILGILTVAGGVTGHSAILARSLGIPALVGVIAAFDRLDDHQMIAFDGASGQLWLDPTPTELAVLQQKRAQWQAAQQIARQASHQPAITRDQRRIEIAANISTPNDVDQGLALGAEGVGLFRTEFLFMGRAQAPSEEEQLAAYQAAAQKLGQRPLIIRTLDIGGDKPLPHLGIRPEANPFLGWRGLRFCLDNPAVFKPQLRAILRASAGHTVKLMLPMVSTLDEVARARTLIHTVQEELRTAKIAFDEAMEIGIMIEVPSAVLLADQLAEAVDFFSIGTNDLTQYLMAADRGNAKVATLMNEWQPAVIRAIHQVVQAAHAASIWVGLCGELAGNPLATPLLIGLGLDELSMNAAAIPQVKAVIRQLVMAPAQQLAAACLASRSVGEIEERLATFSRLVVPTH